MSSAHRRGLVAEAHRRRETEAEFQRAVVELAELCGWRVYHTYDSRRSHPGFPDLVMVRPPRLIFAELKTQTGRTTSEQDAWLNALDEVRKASGGPNYWDSPPETYLWRPPMWDEIVKILR